MELAAKAPATGYLIYLGNISAIAINPATFPNLALSPAREFMQEDFVPFVGVETTRGDKVAQESGATID